MQNSKGKMVLTYSHRDQAFLNHSKFLDFLESLAEQEKLEFWWDSKMSRTLFDEEIKQRFGEADIVICLLTESFFTSHYIKEVESRIARERQKKEGILIVPILLEDCTWAEHKWVSRYHHLPDKPIIPNHNHDRAHTFKMIIDHIRVRIHHQVTPFREPRALYTLRRLPDSSFSKAEKKALLLDSQMRARKVVSDILLRKKICQSARKLLRGRKHRSLGKKELEALDKKFLSKGSRQPDAEPVRWVLRSARLHPQGKVSR